MSYQYAGGKKGPLASTAIPQPSSVVSAQTGQAQIMDLLQNLQASQNLLISDQAKNFSDLKQEMQVMQAGLAKVNEKLLHFEQKIQAIEDVQTVFECRQDELESGLQIIDKTVLNQEIEASAKTIRIQNVPFEDGEDLYTLVGECFAGLLGIPVQEIQLEIDHIRRQPNAYSRKNSLPSEIRVKLVRRQTRDSLLKKAQDQEIKLKDTKIRLLKDLPWRIRQLRKDFLFLTKLLQKNDVPYKWTFPVGLFFRWEGKNIQLDSVKKAYRFAETNAEKIGYTPSSPDEDSDADEDPSQSNRAFKAQSQRSQKFQTRSSHPSDSGTEGGAKPKRQLRLKVDKKLESTCSDKKLSRK